jgi:hypothetical protein
MQEVVEVVRSSMSCNIVEKKFYNLEITTTKKIISHNKD